MKKNQKENEADKVDNTYELMHRLVDDETITQWQKKAKDVRSTQELKEFLDSILEVDHDYNSIEEGFIAGLTATMKAMDRHKNGGITGFQAGWIVHKFMEKELLITCPWRTQRYNDMLYPQYENKFEKTISKEVWDWLQKEAKSKLKELKDSNVEFKPHPDVVNHWKKIADGFVPFDYQVDERE